MARCTCPNYALDLGFKENGKRNIKFLPKRFDLYSKKQLEARYGSESIIALPCGKCLACRLNHSKEWAVRCVLEAMQYDENWFLTLTYNDDNIPSNGLLQRSDLQKFLKRLRARCGSFRYFGCGEYGSKSKRPHYHLILFGVSFDDLKLIGAGLFESKMLNEVWPFGFHYLGSVTYQSCNYVARYSTKKCFDDYPGEFLCASTNPGIGYKYCEDHLKKILDYDSVFGDFGSTKAVKLPRYFEKVAERLDNEAFIEVKSKRIDKSNAFTFNEILKHSFADYEQMLDYNARAQLDDFRKRGMNRR